MSWGRPSNAGTNCRVAETYSLKFLGFASESAEALQRFKTICVADLELSVEETQALLKSDSETKVLISSDSLPEITRISTLLANAGAQVAVVTAMDGMEAVQSDDSSDEPAAELTFNLEDILGEQSLRPAEPKQPKEYHLDLDSSEDLAALGFLPESVGIPNEQPSGETLSFDDELPSPESVDPISQLMDEVAQAVAKPWSESDLDLQLGGAPQELLPPESIPQGVSSLDFDDLSVLPAPLPKEMISSRNPDTTATISTPSPTSSDDLAFDLNDVQPEPAAALKAEAEDHMVSPTKDASPEQISPPQSVAAPAAQPTPKKMNFASALDAISFEKLLDDDPPPFAELSPPVTKPTPQAATPPTAAPEKAPQVAEQIVATSSTTEKPSAPVKIPPTPQPISSQPLEAQSGPVDSIEQDELYGGASSRNHRSNDSEGFSKGQLVGIFLGGICLLVLGNWLLTPEQEEQTLPSIDQVASFSSSTTGAPPPLADRPAKDKATITLPTLQGSFAGPGFDISVSASPQGTTLASKVLVTTPQPAELTLEEIANNTPAKMWLKRAESDVIQLKQVGASEWSGSVPTYIFVERGVERRRLPGLAMLTAHLNPDGKTGEFRVEVSYSPPGDTALPSPGNIIEASGKDLFRVSVSAVVPVKKR